MTKVIFLIGFLATAVTIATIMDNPSFLNNVEYLRKLVRHLMTKLKLFELFNLHNSYAKLEKNL